MIDFVGRRRYYAVLSLLMIIPSLIGLGLWQFEAGLDFAGGLETEVAFISDATLEDIQAALDTIPEQENAPPIASLTVREGEDGSFIIEGAIDEIAVAAAEAEAAAAAEADAEAAVEDEAEGEEVDEEAVEAEAEEPPPLPTGSSLSSLMFSAVSEEVGSFDSLDSSTTEFTATRELWFPVVVAQDDVRAALETVGLGGARIQATAADSYSIRVEQPDDGDLERLRQTINDALRAEIGPIAVRQSTSVSGTLSVEIARDAGIALAVAAAAILIYISLAFRRLPNPVLYGSAAIVALLHDVTIVAGAFAIGGQIAGLEVNAMFVTALLAIIGYSVNDTIVVFDRIRENLLLDPREDFRRVVNAAITQSLGRSLNTSITVVLALLALLLIGGVTIQPFVIVLFIGTVAGTYSSIAVASQIVFLWQDGTLPRLLRRGGEERVVRRVERQT